MSELQHFGAPVLAVCGYSGSGKTTLLEPVIPHLIAQNLSVAVVKHDAHGFIVDREGKDSDRLFRAGATVVLRGPSEQFARRNATSSLTLHATLAEMALDHDLVLVEGHKDTPLPKLWLSNAEGTLPPTQQDTILRILTWDSNRVEQLLAFTQEWLPKEWNAQPLRTGLLIGGKSSRMGTPKQLVNFGQRTLSEVAVHALQSGLSSFDATSHFEPEPVILGKGTLPASISSLTRLADVSNLAGPLAGLLAAHRWAPRCAWLLAACDHPWMNTGDIQQLIAQRKPGRWAVLSRQPDGYPCPTLGIYEPQALVYLERMILANGSENACISWLLDDPRTWIGPHRLRSALDVNTPEALSAEAQVLVLGLDSQTSKPISTREEGRHTNDQL
jgi:molybdopterin-guanine dinucleotide biosynthesis protein A